MGLDEFPEVSDDKKRELEERLDSEGLESLAAKLKAMDPGLEGRMDYRNPARVLRALGVIESGGKPMSWYFDQHRTARPFAPILILLDMPREALYERINRRVDEMIEAGLEDEVRGLYQRRENRVLMTVGYQEWFPYFEGKYDREEAIRLIKRNSRRYAKRQMTWWRGREDFKVFGAEDIEGIWKYVIGEME